MVVDRLENLESASLNPLFAKAMEYPQSYRLERSGIRKSKIRVMIW